MINDPIDTAARQKPALPESLRQAVREAQATGRAAEERAALAMPFRARLRARDAVRPQPTLSILTHSAPITSGPVSHLAVSEVRALERLPKSPPPPRGTVVVPALVPVSTGGSAGLSQQGGSGDDEDDNDERSNNFLGRMGDISQFAFAGLAVLGLAGLSVMAAENALGGKDASGDGEADPVLTTASAGSVSTAVLAAAAEPVAEVTPWFDYRGTADLLKSRIAAIEAEERETVRLASLEADRTAAAAIANAEAARVAAAEPQESSGPAVIDNRVRDRLAAEEAARAAAAAAATRQQTEEAAARAKIESDRLAAEEAARAAALAAEQQRLAKAEQARLAQVETARLADLAAKKKAADAEATRLASIEAAKLAKAAETKRLADIEAKRLAALEAQRLAAAETARAGAAKPVQTAAAAPAPRVWSDPPGRASLKPARPAAPVVLAAVDTTGLVSSVTRSAPPTLSAQQPDVRPIAAPRPVDDFIAERTQQTASRALEATALDALKSDFLRLVETSADGARHTLTTPDGRPLLIHFERTVSVDPLKANMRAISYSPSADGTISRVYVQPIDVNVKVMCRDVTYAFPGQERGRFAACESAEGTWTMARASAPDGIPA